MLFFLNDTATTEIYTLSLHDALPIWTLGLQLLAQHRDDLPAEDVQLLEDNLQRQAGVVHEEQRSEEHTSELQSRQYLVCRLLLEKKKHSRSQYRMCKIQ